MPMLAHARAELPNEACGLLSGSLADGAATAFHPARNAEASPLRYSVHPDDLVRIVFAIEDGGDDLVAIFHSHTRSPAIPSATDRRAAMYPTPSTSWPRSPNPTYRRTPPCAPGGSPAASPPRCP